MGKLGWIALAGILGSAALAGTASAEECDRAPYYAGYGNYRGGYYRNGYERERRDERERREHFRRERARRWWW
jgi:hypothetical protein